MINEFENNRFLCSNDNLFLEAVSLVTLSNKEYDGNYVKEFRTNCFINVQESSITSNIWTYLYANYNVSDFILIYNILKQQGKQLFYIHICIVTESQNRVETLTYEERMAVKGNEENFEKYKGIDNVYHIKYPHKMFLKVN